MKPFNTAYGRHEKHKLDKKSDVSEFGSRHKARKFRKAVKDRETNEQQEFSSRQFLREKRASELGRKPSEVMSKALKKKMKC